MAKKRIIDMICEVSLVLKNNIIHSGEGREFYDHKVYVFDNTFEVRKAKKMLKRKRITTEEYKAKLLSTQKIARIIIKEKIVSTRKGKCVKINYINLFDTDVETSDVTLCDMLKYHWHYLKDKKVLWVWKNKNGEKWNLVLFENNKI